MNGQRRRKFDMSSRAPSADGRPQPIEVLLGVAILVRVHACVTAGVCIVVGVLLTEQTLPLDTIAVMVLVVSAVTAAGNTINDYVDREIDTVNRSKRPIPSGVISPRQACLLAVALFVAGVGASLFLSVWCLVFAFANSCLLVLYAVVSKKLGIMKNLIVGYLVGSVFVFAAYSPDRLNITLFVLAGCAALATVAREIVKDIEDMEGDRLHGATTLPIVLDVRRSYLIAYSVLMLAILISFIPYFMGRMNDLFLILNILGCATFAVGWFGHDAQRTQKIIMAGSIVELVAFVAGSN